MQGITQEDIENFDLMLDSAEKDFQVFDNYLSETSDVIQVLIVFLLNQAL